MRFVICSDQHFHNWREFACQNEDNINSRLQLTIDELNHVAETAQKKKVNQIFFAGDLFHQPGHIQPSVFNPVCNALYNIASNGIEIVMIPGNHDLEFSVSNDIGSPMTIFHYLDVENTCIVNKPIVHGEVALFPWERDLEKLKESMRERAEPYRVAIIHAPINDVLYGIPNNGLVASELADMGYQYVFAGHYHNHKNFGNGVISIGALGHQTWSDVGSLAGHIFVDTDKKIIEHIPSKMPNFVKMQSGDYSACKGNYCKVLDVEQGEENKVRNECFTNGAKAVLTHTKVVGGEEVARSRIDTSLAVTVTSHCKTNDISEEDTGKCLERINEI